MGAKTTARNVALVGASGAGKTTLLESMLFVSGAIGRKGSVADGTTVGDASAEARARQMSTEVSVAGFSAHGLDFTSWTARARSSSCTTPTARRWAATPRVVVVEPVLERMITVAPLAAVPGRARDPAPRVRQQDGPLRGPLPRPAADPARSQRAARGPAPVRDRPRRGSGRLCRPGQRGGPRLPARPCLRRHPGAGRLSRARADGAPRDAGDAGRLRRRPDEPAARGSGAAAGPDPARPAQDAGRRSGGAGVHGRGRAGHGGAPAARGAGQGGAGARRAADPAGPAGRRAGRGPGAQELLPARMPASCRWPGSGAARSRTARRSATCGSAASTGCSAASSRTSVPAEAGEIVAPGPAGRRPHRRHPRRGGHGGACRKPPASQADVRVRGAPRPTATTRSSSPAPSPSWSTRTRRCTSSTTARPTRRCCGARARSTCAWRSTG